MVCCCCFCWLPVVNCNFPLLLLVTFVAIVVKLVFADGLFIILINLFKSKARGLISDVVNLITAH